MKVSSHKLLQLHPLATHRIYISGVLCHVFIDTSVAVTETIVETTFISYVISLAGIINMEIFYHFKLTNYDNTVKACKN